jgi:AcrR family transcriptional regulator
MTAPQESRSSPDTRERLIHIAAELFAECGYQATSVRDICKAAEANVSAVNYHFGDKLKLYREAFDFAYRCETFELPSAEAHDSPPEARLRQYIASHIDFIVLHGDDSLLGRLLAQEFRSPTALIPHIAEEAIRPRAMLLRGIITELLGEAAGEDLVRNIHLSIIGQCVFYHQKEPFLHQIYPKLKFDCKFAAALIDHITEFSLAGIVALRQAKAHST